MGLCQTETVSWVRHVAEPIDANGNDKALPHLARLTVQEPHCVRARFKLRAEYRFDIARRNGVDFDALPIRVEISKSWNTPILTLTICSVVHAEYTRAHYMTVHSQTSPRLKWEYYRLHSFRYIYADAALGAQCGAWRHESSA